MLRKLQNFSEKQVFHQIDKLTRGYGATIYQKIRLADVVDISALTNARESRFALMGHLDFVVASEDDIPLFAIEYDGLGHDGKNDLLKDSICGQADLALIRVMHTATRVSCSKMSFLEYLVHVWFMGAAFEDARAEGIVPPDEPFVMHSFLKPNAKHIFDSEFNFFGPTASKINELFEKGKIRAESRVLSKLAHLSLTHAVFQSENGQYRSYCSMPVDSSWIVGQARLDIKIPSYGALTNVPFSRSELGQYCEGLALNDLYEGLQIHADGGAHALGQHEEFLDEIRGLKSQKYRLLQGGGGLDGKFLDLMKL